MSCRAGPGFTRPRGSAADTAGNDGRAARLPPWPGGLIYRGAAARDVLSSGALVAVLVFIGTDEHDLLPRPVRIGGGKFGAYTFGDVLKVFDREP